MKKILLTITISFAYQFAMFIYGHQWLTDLLPTGDFAGSVAVVAELKQILTNGHLSNWSSLRFCGSPNTMLWSFLDWLVYVPFAFIFEPVMAVKVGSLFFLGLAGASMFGLCFYYCRRTLISFWAGLVYMISPIFLFSAVHTGHTNFPPYYALQPLAFLALWRLSEKPDRKRLFLAALAVVLAVWTDTERAFSSLPFVFAFIIAAGLLKTSTVFDRQLLRNQAMKLTWLATSGLIAVLLSAFFLVPMAIEKSHIALFSEEVLANSRTIFGLNNLLHLVDRDGWLVRKLAGYLPNRDCYDAGNYYLGISTVLLLSTVCLAHNKRDNRIRFVWTAIVIYIFMIWTASGTTSIYDNLSTQMTGLYKHLRYANEHPYLLPSVSIGIFVLIGLFCYLRAKLSCPSWSLTRIAIAVGFLLIVSYTAIFPLLAHLPLYSHMRNPGFFMSALPPLLIVLAGALLLAHFTETLGKVSYTLVIVAVTVLTLTDYGSYRTGFSRQVSPQLVRDFHDASIVMKNHPSPGRYLSRESYSPLADMHASYTDRGSAWYWLNWSCPKGTHHAFMNRIYPQLHHPDTIEQALALAG
ncbi:hypothetical protein KAR91_68780, partial [Candidatus Pacearchaeota archaeon]|nr:hypothetical protein [Candidatus Pacearchaeota archaeon]